MEYLATEILSIMIQWKAFICYIFKLKLSRFGLQQKFKEMSSRWNHKKPICCSFTRELLRAGSERFDNDKWYWVESPIFEYNWASYSPDTIHPNDQFGYLIGDTIQNKIDRLLK